MSAAQNILLPGSSLGRSVAAARLAAKEAQVNALQAARGFGDGVTSVIRDAAAPVESAASAARYTAVAVAVATVAIVIAVVYVTRKVLP